VRTRSTDFAAGARYCVEPVLSAELIYLAHRPHTILVDPHTIQEPLLR